MSSVGTCIADVFILDKYRHTFCQLQNSGRFWLVMHCLFFYLFFSIVTKLTIHNYKQEQKQDMHIIMTLAQHVLEYITQIQLFNTPIQFQVILVNNLTIKKKYITNSIFFSLPVVQF